VKRPCVPDIWDGHAGADLLNRRPGSARPLIARSDQDPDRRRSTSVAPRDDGPKAHLALSDAFISFGDLVERLRLGHDFNLARGGDLQGFVQVFAIILLAAEDVDAAHDQIAEMDR
jgi:hypothetical protein